jgi:hypothetical protein
VLQRNSMSERSANPKISAKSGTSVSADSTIAFPRERRWRRSDTPFAPPVPLAVDENGGNEALEAPGRMATPEPGGMAPHSFGLTCPHAAVTAHTRVRVPAFIIVFIGSIGVFLKVR